MTRKSSVPGAVGKPTATMKPNNQQSPIANSRRSPRTKGKPRIALALAGGGPLGAIYEIGALCALEQSLVGLEMNRLDH